MKRAIYSIVLLFALTGCVERYYPQTEGIESILVVEGIITNGTTQIALSYSVGLDININKIYTENQATIYVECEDGTTSAMTCSSGDGIYLIETGELNAGAKYRLVIQLAGEEYHSRYITPAITPPVDVTYIHDPINNSMNICVSTSGNDNQPGYYLWSYKEDWEVHAFVYEEFWSITFWDKNTGKFVTEVFHNDLTSPNNVYYCWKADSSRVFLLGTTEKISENSIREREIKSFKCFDNRLSVLYRMKIRQNTLNKEGYDYFENLKKNAEQTGNLFGSIPSELMGNIRCVSNPAIPVIGYVDVSTTTTDELYLTDKYYDWRNRDEQIRECGGEYAQDLFFYCRDCTDYGTKRKPKDWPNDHQ